MHNAYYPPSSSFTLLPCPYLQFTFSSHRLGTNRFSRPTSSGIALSCQQGSPRPPPSRPQLQLPSSVVARTTYPFIVHLGSPPIRPLSVAKHSILRGSRDLLSARTNSPFVSLCQCLSMVVWSPNGWEQASSSVPPFHTDEIGS